MRSLTLAAAALCAVMPVAASAHERAVPYWAAIRAAELNMRAGPGRDYPIRWVYRRAGLPVKVIRVHEGWRLVRDPAGDEGWMTVNLLTPERSAIVTGAGLAAMRDAASDSARLKWNLEPGVVGKLGDCDDGWCKLDVAGHVGFVRANRLWGAGEP